MSDSAAELPEIESPCIQVCRLDDQGTCIGCFRTASEIARWLGYTPGQRRDIIESLPARAARHFDAE